MRHPYWRGTSDYASPYPATDKFAPEPVREWFTDAIDKQFTAILQADDRKSRSMCLFRLIQLLDEVME